MRLVVDVLRRTDLLNATVVHHHHSVGHGQRFLLVVRHIDKRDTQPLLDVLQLGLHILAQLEIQRRQRLVEQQHTRVVRQRTGDGDALLLTAGQCGHAAFFKALEVDQRQHLLHDLAYLRIRFLLQTRSECHVFKHIQMRKQRVTLEDRVDLPFVRRHIVDAFSVKKDIAAVRCDEAADDPQRSRLAAAGRAEQRDKFSIVDAEVKPVQHLFTVKRNCDVFQCNNILHQSSIPLCGIGICRSAADRDTLNNALRKGFFTIDSPPARAAAIAALPDIAFV